MKNETIRLSDAELLLLDALWAASPLHASDIAERLAVRGWSVQTIRTMLVRLEAKGAVVHEEQGRRYLYRPLVARAEIIEKESERLVDRLLGGRAAPLIARLAEQRKLSAEDVTEIRALLDRIGS